MLLYMNEPEYSEMEINAMNILENENLSDSSEELDFTHSSRLGNLHWCSYFECGISLTTLKVENFAGTKFCSFRGFRGQPRNLIPAKLFTTHPRNFIPAKFFHIGYPQNLITAKVSLLR